MSYYKEGHNRTVDKNIGVLNLPNCSFSFSIYVIRYIRSDRIFPSGSRTVTVRPGRTFDQPDIFGPCRVPEPW
jgi:hypothetical protein